MLGVREGQVNETGGETGAQRSDATNNTAPTSVNNPDGGAQNQRSAEGLPRFSAPASPVYKGSVGLSFPRKGGTAKCPPS
jgi:hypothetical protein